MNRRRYGTIQGTFAYLARGDAATTFPLYQVAFLERSKYMRRKLLLTLKILICKLCFVSAKVYVKYPININEKLERHK